MSYFAEDYGMQKRKLLLFLVAVGLMAGIAQANMLSNPGFEDGTWGKWNVPDHWSTWGNTTQAWSWNATAGRGGGKCVWLHCTPGTDRTEAWMGQYVPVAPGTEYAFSVWARAVKGGPAAGAADVYGYITWLDAASATISDYWLYPDAAPETTWEKVTFSMSDGSAIVAPEGAVWGGFWVAGYYTNDEEGGIYIDDATVTPEPITLGLLGLGGLMLARRRKKA